MSVTQNYKKITLSWDVMFQVRLALEYRMDALRERAVGAERWSEVDRLNLAGMTDDTAAALAAVVATFEPDTACLKVSNGMDAAEAMRLAAVAVRFMLRVEERMKRDPVGVSLFDVMDGQVRVNPAGLRTTLLFLESPK